MDILDSIDIAIDADRIRHKLNGADAAERLIQSALPLIKARAVFRAARVDVREGDAIVIEGRRFASRVLARLLAEAERVFPYVMTIGDLPDRRAAAETDPQRRQDLDFIANYALVQTRRSVEERLRSRFGLEKIAYMSPGSIQNWPIDQQQPLFDLLTGATEALGVSLTTDCRMTPDKSLSGIYFSTEADFFVCQLCPYENCPGRKAPYDAELAAKLTAAP